MRARIGEGSNGGKMTANTVASAADYRPTKQNIAGAVIMRRYSMKFHVQARKGGVRRIVAQ